jgi:HSP20 family protein
MKPKTLRSVSSFKLQVSRTMAKKPSFFQKLTGAEEAEESETSAAENEQTDQTNSMEENPPKENIITNIPKPKPARVKKTAPIEKNGPASAGEEWLPESEGQLTIDVYQTPSDIIIKSTIAGVNPEDIDISISNDMVTIKGYRTKDEEIKSEDYYYQECYWGAFSRSVILPVDIEADKAEASMKNGILTLSLPKIEKIKTRKIKIKTV